MANTAARDVVSVGSVVYDKRERWEFILQQYTLRFSRTWEVPSSRHKAPRAPPRVRTRSKRRPQTPPPFCAAKHDRFDTLTWCTHTPFRGRRRVVVEALAAEIDVMWTTRAVGRRWLLQRFGLHPERSWNQLHGHVWLQLSCSA
ncbi:hypothetical protein H310_11614 [Aphanomyces invadans]|uniref:Uncharacterized protein n=1 Tax=Aphanomyces invadans TaxID=157072 RepID=A0A024TLX1_9STRA|nr:hypothetical protein H310_11614 [Aphanomyces invadans]ETV94974.1 hypothetical protein H310_11614 [Aphanomyces invadans]|eukprot:XP_008876565.1 hypothetical protein H310_11614 [Aphanomyces invadans]